MFILEELPYYFQSLGFCFAARCGGPPPALRATPPSGGQALSGVFAYRIVLPRTVDALHSIIKAY